MSQFWLIGNRTSCHPILSVIILMINKSDSHESLEWLQTELNSTRCYRYYHYLFDKKTKRLFDNQTQTNHCLSTYLVYNTSFNSCKILTFWFTLSYPINNIFTFQHPQWWGKSFDHSNALLFFTRSQFKVLLNL